MIQNDKIDVIIPAYNVPDEILMRCLASIYEQNIINDINVVIVDDASSVQNYQEVVDRFKGLSTKILTMKKNGGPGDARQFGLDQTCSPFVTFVDADDTLNGSFALTVMRKQLLDNPVNIMVSSVFMEVHDEKSDLPLCLPHSQDLVWMFGKMYRRSFLERNNVHFLPGSRANEDNGFNTIIRLCASEQEQICFISEATYFWHENENSITRANNCEYSYGGGERNSFHGYTENMIFAITEAKKHKPYNGYISLWSVDCMMNLYEYYIECEARSPKTAVQNFECCKRYFEAVYSKIEVSEEMLIAGYNEVMKNAYMGSKLEGIIPCMGIREFLESLKSDLSATQEKLGCS